MKENEENPYELLERIFHEPNRLSIMSALCASAVGLSFSELKETCDLTDGNLNRHLHVLKQADAVVVEKAFVAEKPRTTVTLSTSGLARFSEYLAALEDVLHKARRAVPAEKRQRGAFPFASPVKA